MATFPIRALLLSMSLLLLPVRPALADDGGDAPPPDEQPAPGADDGSASAPSLAEAYPGFPDPVLMRRARTYRAVGVTLSAVGVAALLVNFNAALAVLRSGNDAARDALPYYAVPLAVVSIVGLEVGAPLWSVGAEMNRQLTRKTRGDEKLRRAVANDPRYWRGRMLHAFGTTMAITGGLGVAIGSLVLVGGIWVNDQFGGELDEFRRVALWSILGPVIMLGAGTAALIGGLRMRKQGLDRSQRVRDAYATTQLLPIPYLDPVTRGGGLAIVGRF